MSVGVSGTGVSVGVGVGVSVAVSAGVHVKVIVFVGIGGAVSVSVAVAMTVGVSVTGQPPDPQSCATAGRAASAPNGTSAVARAATRTCLSAPCNKCCVFSRNSARQSSCDICYPLQDPALAKTATARVRSLSLPCPVSAL